MTYAQLMEDENFIPSVVIDGEGTSKVYPTPRHMERFYRFLGNMGHLSGQPKYRSSIYPAMKDDRPAFPKSRQ